MKKAQNSDILFELTDDRELKVMNDLQQYFATMYFAN